MTDVAIEASIEPQETFAGGGPQKTGAYDWSIDMVVTPAVGKPKTVRRSGRSLDRGRAVAEVVREIEGAL
jgi:hypothetical protein